jgi:hypothetical protein
MYYMYTPSLIFRRLNQNKNPSLTLSERQCFHLVGLLCDHSVV